MKPPYSIPTETICNGDKSLAYEYKKQNALAPPNDLASIAWTKLQFFGQGFTKK